MDSSHEAIRSDEDPSKHKNGQRENDQWIAAILKQRLISKIPGSSKLPSQNCGA